MPVGIILHTSSPTQTHNDLGSLTIVHQPTLPSYLLTSKLFIEKKKIRDFQLTSGRAADVYTTQKRTLLTWIWATANWVNKEYCCYLFIAALSLMRKWSHFQKTLLFYLYVFSQYWGQNGLNWQPKILWGSSKSCSDIILSFNVIVLFIGTGNSL